MNHLWLTAVLTAPIYLLPGFCAMELFELKDVKWGDRLFFSLCISFVIVPTSFIFVGNVLHFIPGLTAYLILIFLLLAVGLALRLFHRRPEFKIPQPTGISPLETVCVWVAIFLFAVVANLSRIAMFVQGPITLDVGTTYDESRHLAEVVSVARTGIPPMNYFFPGIRLVYYYSSWIYPALFGNLPSLQISLSRTLAIHAFVQIFAFLGLVYYLLRYNFKKWWVRLTGVSFFTLMGGFGLFANAPSIIGPESWQSQARWLSSVIPITPFADQFAWVPQHIAGGIAFLFGLLVWKNLKASHLLKSILTGFLLSFCFTTSIWVFIASILVLGLVLFINAKTLRANWKNTLLDLSLMGVVFLLVCWYTLLTYASHGSGFTFNDFRILTVELLRGGSATSVWIDRTLTILGFPLVMGWIGLISIGLPFLLYMLWTIKGVLSSQKPVWTNDLLVVAVFPAFYLLLNVLFTDVNGGGGFALRGMIPALILINFGALYLLESQAAAILNPSWLKWLFLYLFVCFLIPEGLSAYAQIRWAALAAVRSVLTVDLQPHHSPDWQLAEGTAWSWSGDLAYIPWLNVNTPASSLIIEDGCPTNLGDQYRYHWLERVRFLDPTCSLYARFFAPDLQLVSPTELSSLMRQEKKYPNLLAFYEATVHIDTYKSVYYVDRTRPPNPEWGSPVYVDGYVRIYRIR